MTNRASLALVCLLSPVVGWAQQANVNLDFNPQKNTEKLIPFSASLNKKLKSCPVTPAANDAAARYRNIAAS